MNENKLPTKEEYEKSIGGWTSCGFEQWSEPKYQCPVCGGGMCKNLTVILTTWPEQYTYMCNKCGHVETQFK